MANGGGIVRRPAVPPPVRIRRNIKLLSLTDPIVVFYSRAIDRMQSLPINNPLSWRYQAAIHDYPFPDVDDKKPDDKLASFNLRRINPANLPGPTGTFRRDPLARLDDNLPGDRGTFWRQCQHASWYFLPWHRMYLHHFEKIVAAHVLALKGPEDWALPYWDWTAKDGNQRIPNECRTPRFPDGTKNFLFIPERSVATGQNANNGDVIGDPGVPGDPNQPDDMDSAFRCLTPSKFAGKGEFGGPRVRLHRGQGPPEIRPVPNSDLDGSGLLEGTPHGSIHVATGGLSQDGKAWMTQFTQAALDPIFWMHHCNIDRLWEVWIQRDRKNLNPDEKDWLDPPGFPFHNATGGTESMTPRKVVQTRTPPLSYEYDDTTDPTPKGP